MQYKIELTRSEPIGSSKPHHHTKEFVLRAISTRGMHISCFLENNLLAQIPKILSQALISSVHTRFLFIAISKVFATDSSQLWSKSHIQSCCCTLVVHIVRALY